MDILNILFYKSDESTNQLRISKTKIISLIVFVSFFILALYIYLTTPSTAGGNWVINILAAIIFGLMFAVPTFIIGWLIGKFLNRNKSNNVQQDYTQNYTQNNTQDYTQNNIQTQPEYTESTPDFNENLSNFNETTSQEQQNLKNIVEVQEYSQEFKTAIEEDNSDEASELLSKWDNNDANCKYASIIFEGMPPSELSLNDLNEMLNAADKMKASNESLKEWYRSTALQVIELNKE